MNLPLEQQVKRISVNRMLVSMGQGKRISVEGMLASLGREFFIDAKRKTEADVGEYMYFGFHSLCHLPIHAVGVGGIDTYILFAKGSLGCSYEDVGARGSNCKFLQFSRAGVGARHGERAGMEGGLHTVDLCTSTRSFLVVIILNTCEQKKGAVGSNGHDETR